MVLITVDVADPHHSMFPAAVVAESHSAHPMMVDEPAVQAANVIAPLLDVVEAAPAPPAVAALNPAAAITARAYPV